jgi:hypothetical protein
MNSLGYAGLIPFVVPALLIALNSDYSQLLLHITEGYGFGIICFLTGSWWGIAMTTQSSRVLLLSNLVFLITFFTYISESTLWSLVAALLLMSIFYIEHYTNVLPASRIYYRKMRGTLSIVASISMLSIYISSTLMG